MKKVNTVKKYREFKEILKIRHFYKNELFCVYFRENVFGYTRVGLLITKRNGIAVIRNKIKRQVRSIIDGVLDYKKNLDVIVVINKKYDPNEYIKNKEKLEELLLLLLGENNERKK